MIFAHVDAAHMPLRGIQSFKNCPFAHKRATWNHLNPDVAFWAESGSCGRFKGCGLPK